MSLWDNIKKFTQPYSDEDYDDYENENLDNYDEEEAPEPAARSRRTSPFEANAQAPGSSYSTSAASSASSSGFNGHVVNGSSGSGRQDVVLFHAKSFDDAAKAADELRNKKAVILNMENVDKSLTRRVVDFLSGSVYALDGKVKKVAQSTYFFCPHTMNVLGDLENIASEVESYI